MHLCNCIYLDEAQLNSLKPRIVTFDQDNQYATYPSISTQMADLASPSLTSEGGFGHSGPRLWGMTCFRHVCELLRPDRSTGGRSHGPNALDKIAPARST